MWVAAHNKGLKFDHLQNCYVLVFGESGCKCHRGFEKDPNALEIRGENDCDSRTSIILADRIVDRRMRLWKK